MCVCTDGHIQEKGRASTTGRWRKESQLGTLDLALGARHSGWKKRRDTERGDGALQGRATVKGRERGDRV